MYSLIRVWIGLKLARIEIHDSVVVRTTSATDSPSAPSLYWMPKIGIQSTVSTNWKPGPIRQVAEQQEERDDPGHQREAERDRARRAGRSDGHGQRADERQEDDDREDRDAGDVHRQRPASRRYEPAITIRPMAMPRA